jgi:uncharacterized cupredoxin-like copper-binding protein
MMRLFSPLWLLFLLAAMTAAPVHAQAGAAGPPADTLVVRSSGPSLEFTPDRISAREGTRVVLRYVNGGDLPHNLVIVREDGDVDRVVEAAYSAQSTGFIPRDLADLFVAHTPLASPGETVDIEFEMPPAGEYTFICLVPGHANMMLGVLRSLR